jgi:transcriptional regulator with XRE-family HTH domain
MALGQRMRQLRETKGWTHETLAERANIDRSYVAGIEAGLRNPSVKTLSKIARGFGVSLSTFLETV